MTNHPNRSAAKIEVMMAGQGLAHIYLDRKFVATISTDANGRWIMRLNERSETINVTGIFHNTAELNQAIRLFLSIPETVAVAWPSTGLRGQCKTVMAALA